MLITPYNCIYYTIISKSMFSSVGTVKYRCTKVGSKKSSKIELIFVATSAWAASAACVLWNYYRVTS